MRNVNAGTMIGIVFAIFGVLALAPGPAGAAGCFNPTDTAPFVMLVIELAGGTAPFFSLVGEVVANTAQGRVSSPVAGTAFVRADGTAPFTLLGAVIGPVIGTLSPPGYDHGFVQGAMGQIPITAVPCPPLPQ